MTVYAITDTKKGEQGLRLLIFKLPRARFTAHSPAVLTGLNDVFVYFYSRCNFDREMVMGTT